MTTYLSAAGLAVWLMMFGRFTVLPLGALFTMTPLISQSNPFESHFVPNPLSMFKSDFIFSHSSFLYLKYVKLNFVRL